MGVEDVRVAHLILIRHRILDKEAPALVVKARRADMAHRLRRLRLLDSMKRA